MRENIINLVKSGHDVSFNADVTLYAVESEGDGGLSRWHKYYIEIYDPIDDDTQELMHDTFKGCELMQRFYRNNDFWVKELVSIEEAADIYLQVCDWLKQSQ